MTPSFTCLVKSVTHDKTSKLNILEFKDSLNVNKYFKPRKVKPIPPDLAATIGRYKPSKVGQIFSACAQEITNTSTNNSDDGLGIQWEIDQARAYLPTLQLIWTFLKGTKQSTMLTWI